ncbi:hypothetical protein PUW24_11320 [Paenibacillus urinalis]|uniref:Uncharacterized protein n=1 Tax=Paenibacillus urinalis TaxID=521520 RepID=A0AAX3N185_9BACL|nr:MULTISPECIES: hypothetical protein [Paenibacillus]WDH83383.1 hypothetical protein PUW23_03825 [Paenibacillus urinalis]WDH99424.1 hypothetical protein PUW24_11320 [Paenibacillus urinalis]WDI03058.1 hypothetical protein PUW25_03465 [Paenibacillus urinalis]GAK41758.1 hypothetical protein TCA2_4250 [Paenibacillus sp. TCA20]
MTADRLIDQQLKVVEEAVGKHYVSPQLVLCATEFAEEQGELLQKYDPVQQLFFLTDGEPYSHEAIVKYCEDKKAAAK